MPAYIDNIYHYYGENFPDDRKVNDADDEKSVKNYTKNDILLWCNHVKKAQTILLYNIAT